MNSGRAVGKYLHIQIATSRLHPDLPRTRGGSSLKGVGFFSRGWHGGRDARVPSVACAGNASVSLAWWQRCPARQRREQARPQKTYPFKNPSKG